MKFGSPIAQAAQPFISGQYDVIYDATAQLNSGSNVSTILNNLTLNCYDSLLIETNGIVTGGATLLAVTASIGFPLWGTGPAFSTGINAKGYAYLPIANRIGDNLNIGLIFNQAPTGGSTLQVRILGFTNTPPPLYRADGRCYPQGIFAGDIGIAATGNITLIAAIANIRVMLKYAAVNNSVAGALVAIQATIAGNLTNILVARGTSDLSGEWESGILCDINTPVLVSSLVNGTGDGSAIYDLVSS